MMTRILLLLLALGIHANLAFAAEAEPLLSEAEKEAIRTEIEQGVRTTKKNQAVKKFEQETFESMVHEQVKGTVGVEYTEIFSGKDFDPNPSTQGSTDTKGATVTWAYFLLQYKWLGRVGLGGNLSFSYGKEYKDNVGDQTLFTLGAGPSVLYDMKILENQIVVPYVQYSHVYTSADFKGNVVRTVNNQEELVEVSTETTFWESRLNLGVLINLNSVEQAAARSMYQNLGIRKTNIAVSYGQSKDSGDRIYAGLRFEY